MNGILKIGLLALFIFGPMTTTDISTEYVNNIEERGDSGITDNTFADNDLLEDASPDMSTDFLDSSNEMDNTIDETYDNQENAQDDEGLPEKEDVGPIPIDSAGLDPSNPKDHLTKFLDINKQLKTYEDSYKACLCFF